MGERRTLLRLLVECSRGLEAGLRAGLREAGYGDIRPAHYAVFRHLGSEGSRVTKMAEAAGITQQSMGELVAHLERLGFVERRPDPRDGRARIVVPTEMGRGGIAAAARILAETEADLAERMGEEKLGSLVSMLEELSALLAPCQVEEPVADARSGKRR